MLAHDTPHKEPMVFSQLLLILRNNGKPCSLDGLESETHRVFRYVSKQSIAVHHEVKLSTAWLSVLKMTGRMRRCFNQNLDEAMILQMRASTSFSAPSANFIAVCLCDTNCYPQLLFCSGIGMLETVVNLAQGIHYSTTPHDSVSSIWSMRQ